MHAVFQYCEAVAPGHEPVLVTGETGTGKELVARALHSLSGRQGPFVAVNVAGVDDQVFTDTLFGHAKGAFTGADRTRAGLIEKAAGGTLFLDEIGDLSETSQVKLLRVLQEREYSPLGSDLTKPAETRVIAATQFGGTGSEGSPVLRRDLYFRLSTHHIHLPPLRERREDVPLLLDHFLAEAAEAFGRPRPAYPPELLTLLGIHAYPGNVRELRAMVFDAVGRHKGGVLSMESFRERIAADWKGAVEQAAVSSGADSSAWLTGLERLPTLQEATQGLIAEAMRRAGDNQRIAATLLGISHQALSKRLKRSAD